MKSRDEPESDMSLAGCIVCVLGLVGIGAASVTVLLTILGAL